MSRNFWFFSSIGLALNDPFIGIMLDGFTELISLFKIIKLLHNMIKPRPVSFCGFIPFRFRYVIPAPRIPRRKQLNNTTGCACTWNTSSTGRTSIFYRIVNYFLKTQLAVESGINKTSKFLDNSKSKAEIRRQNKNNDYVR